MNIAAIFSTALICALPGIRALAGEQPVSVAEQRLFLAPHLDNTAQARLLRYSYERSGSTPGAFTDRVEVTLDARASPTRRKAHVQFLSGERTLALPDAENATGNPAILSFLERDVREMQRMSSGRANYFRKRVRLALADAARVEDINVEVAGARVPAWRISLTPYLEDPLRARFEQLAGKTYEFVLSEHVPGWVYEMRTTVPGVSGTPLIQEVMRFAGSEP